MAGWQIRFYQGALWKKGVDPYIFKSRTAPANLRRGDNPHAALLAAVWPAGDAFNSSTLQLFNYSTLECLAEGYNPVIKAVDVLTRHFFHGQVDGRWLCFAP